jgi:hypothetical protein
MRPIRSHKKVEETVWPVVSQKPFSGCIFFRLWKTFFLFRCWRTGCKMSVFSMIFFPGIHLKVKQKEALVTFSHEEKEREKIYNSHFELFLLVQLQQQIAL